MIKKPMKAPSNGASVEELAAMIYPIACSPKLDGIRGIITPAGVLSNSLKPLGNRFLQQELSDSSLIGLDGELIVGLPYKNLLLPDDDVFNRTTGAIRRSEGKPEFTYYVFDNFLQKDQNYYTRWLQRTMTDTSPYTHPRVQILEQRICYSFQEALAYESDLLAQGYEGMMARCIFGPYKEGRTTTKEALLLKRKPLAQDEAVVLDIFEQRQNTNEKSINELGHSFRSTHQENLIGKGTLGGVILKSPRWQEPFHCGTIIGGTLAWRQEMWDHPERIIGKTMTYVYQEYGSIDKPRQPRAKAEFRDIE